MDGCRVRREREEEAGVVEKRAVLDGRDGFGELWEL